MPTNRSASASTSTPDLTQAYRDSLSLSLPELVGRLQDVLGAKLLAHIAGTKDAKAVYDWGRGQRTPRQDVETRLRETYHALAMIQMVDSDDVARAWFIGLNPQLDDTAPATALREGLAKDVLVAARSFVQTS